MYHPVRRKMLFHCSITAFLLLTSLKHSRTDNADKTEKPDENDDNLDNNIIDFDSEYDIKLKRQFGENPWHENSLNKAVHRYTVINQENDNVKVNNKSEIDAIFKTSSKEITTENDLLETTSNDLSVIPIELLSTTVNDLISLLESTTEPDLTVIPLSTTEKVVPDFKIEQTVTLPVSTTDGNIQTTLQYEEVTATERVLNDNKEDELNLELTTNKEPSTTAFNLEKDKPIQIQNETTTSPTLTTETKNKTNKSIKETDNNNITNIEKTNKTKLEDEDVAIFTELDLEEEDVPEDYYDAKDVLPTKPPNNDALSVIFGLAGSVVESVAERVVPKGIFDLFKRMQKQNEALEAERLRSREENGGIGQFGRGILKSISSGLRAPLNQLMAGVRDIGSLDNDRGFVSSVASGVSSVANVANSLGDAFKNRVQAIYPGTLWCGDGHSAQARTSDLGLFFFTDTCCRQHDACKIYIKAGETKYGLTNTGLFTRSHCSCDAKFRDCLQKTNSLVSSQIGLTYFNVLGPQCFRRTHPIVRCARRTRITGQKCEEYELDFTKPKMWQWFDNETF